MSRFRPSLNTVEIGASHSLLPIRHLFQEVVHPLAKPDTPGAFYRGLRLMGIDGTVLNAPDTPANHKTFGRPSGEDAKLPNFEVIGKGAFSAAEPRAGQGIGLWFTKEDTK